MTTISATARTFEYLDANRNGLIDELTENFGDERGGPSICRVSIRQKKMNATAFETHLLASHGVQGTRDIEAYAEEMHLQQSWLADLGRGVASFFSAIFGFAYTLLSPAVAVGAFCVGFFDRRAWTFLFSGDLFAWGQKPVLFWWKDLPSTAEVREELTWRIGGACAEPWPRPGYLPRTPYLDVKASTPAQKEVIERNGLDLDLNGAIDAGRERRRIEAAINNPLTAPDVPVLQSLRVGPTGSEPALPPLVPAALERDILNHEVYSDFRTMLRLMSGLDEAQRAYMFNRILMVHGFYPEMLEVPAVASDPVFVDQLRSQLYVAPVHFAWRITEALHFTLDDMRAYIVARPDGGGYSHETMLHLLMQSPLGSSVYALPSDEFAEWIQVFPADSQSWLWQQYKARLPE